MAERRMFAKTIIDSDAFIDMPQSTQNLYFHLSMRADDDGFINSPKVVMRSIGCKDDDMSLLIMKKFIIPFENGIVVIKHWKIHNYIQSDRYTPTKYVDQKKQLELDENKAYRLPKTECIQDVYTLDTQVRLGEVSLGEISKTPKGHNFVKPSVEEVKSYCKSRNNDIDAEEFIDFYESKGWLIGKNKMKSWEACIRTWEKNHTGKRKQIAEPIPDYEQPKTMSADEIEALKERMRNL